jgi:hypothetical protein
MTYIASGMEKLRQMFDVVNIFSYRFELLEIDEHLRRIFDLILSSTLFETFTLILDWADNPQTAQIKLEVLKIIGLASVGLRLFSDSDISIVKDSD